MDLSRNTTNCYNQKSIKLPRSRSKHKCINNQSMYHIVRQTASVSIQNCSNRFKIYVLFGRRLAVPFIYQSMKLHKFTIRKHRFYIQYSLPTLNGRLKDRRSLPHKQNGLQKCIQLKWSVAHSSISMGNANEKYSKLQTQEGSSP